MSSAFQPRRPHIIPPATVSWQAEVSVAATNGGDDDRNDFVVRSPPKSAHSGVGLCTRVQQRSHCCGPLTGHIAQLAIILGENQNRIRVVRVVWLALKSYAVVFEQTFTCFAALSEAELRVSRPIRNSASSVARISSLLIDRLIDSRRPHVARRRQATTRGPRMPIRNTRTPAVARSGPPDTGCQARSGRRAPPVVSPRAMATAGRFPTTRESESKWDSTTTATKRKKSAWIAVRPSGTPKRPLRERICGPRNDDSRSGSRVRPGSWRQSTELWAVSARDARARAPQRHQRSPASRTSLVPELARGRQLKRDQMRAAQIPTRGRP